MHLVIFTITVADINIIEYIYMAELITDGHTSHIFNDSTNGL